MCVGGGGGVRWRKLKNVAGAGRGQGDQTSLFASCKLIEEPTSRPMAGQKNLNSANPFPATFPNPTPDETNI